MGRSGKRVEHLALAAELRARGSTVAETAAALRERYGLDARVAVRTACGWSQADTAAAWCQRWPDDPRTFKSISYWERWPSPTGHAPSLAVLDRLAQLYGCAVADLLAGWGEHGPTRPSGTALEHETLLWQVRHLDLPELTRSVADWVANEPDERRRPALLKLSTAAAIAGADPPLRRSSGRSPTGTGALAGTWNSTYTYSSTSRGRDFDGTHVVDLSMEDGRLQGRSRPHPEGSALHLDLNVDGPLVTGTWTERTSPTGHYRAATYGGLLHMVTDPTGGSLVGMWTGVSKRYTIKSGTWRLDRVPEPPVGP